MVFSDSQKSDVKIIYTVGVSLQASSDKLVTVTVTCPFERAAASMVTDKAHVNNVVKNANGIRETQVSLTMMVKEITILTIENALKKIVR